MSSLKKCNVIFYSTLSIDFNLLFYLCLFTHLYRVIANRLALDAQGRLILRDTGKIVLPYEHFANAVMLKHMTGPHGLHLSVEATIRSVVESYTIGRENFGMEKEFVVEVVQSCPNPACRYYKNHLGTGNAFMDAAFQSTVTPPANVDFMQYGHLTGMQTAGQQATTPQSQSTNASAERNKIDTNKQSANLAFGRLNQSPLAQSALGRTEQPPAEMLLENFQNR